jgi:predicted RNA binding protein YcfA (HicA-like mRNA interferase family)
LKRRELVRHLEVHGCKLLREGGNHTVYVNRAARKSSTIPRHTEINNKPRSQDLHPGSDTHSPKPAG